MPKQLKVSIDDDARDFVEEIAGADAVSSPDIVRKALDSHKYLRKVDEVDGRKVDKADGEIVLRRADGAFERLLST